MRTINSSFVKMGFRVGGYSLIEMIVVLTLIMIVFFIGAPKLSKKTSDMTETRAAALRLVEDMRHLRQRAITSGAPTALVVPSANLTKGHCQGYVMKEGNVTKNIINIVDFRKIYPRVSLFVGIWSINSAQLHNPALGQSSAAILKLANNSGYETDKWSNGSNDYIFLFTPEGTVLANGNMPQFDNMYHIIVGEYYTYVSSALPAGKSAIGSLQRCFSLDNVWSPVYTISISPSGEIQLQEGITGITANLLAGSPAPKWPGEGAPLPPFQAGNEAPEITEISLNPEINRNYYPDPSIHAVIHPGETLSIRLKATDSDGDPLTLTPEVTSSTTPATGSFSPPGTVDMTFIPAENYYLASLQWTPPQGMSPGDRYTLSFTVDDARLTDSEARDVLSAEDGHIVYSAWKSGISNTEIYIMNADGTGERRITENTFGDQQPCLSSDGTRIAFFTNRAGPMDWEVYVMNVDGTGEKNVSNDPSATDYYPCWSPDGTKLAYVSIISPNYRIITMNADGTGKQQIGLGGNPRWSPDGTKISYGNGEINIMNSDGTGNTTLTSPPGYKHDNAWSPNGLQIAYVSSETGQNELYVIDVDGTDKRQLTFNTGVNHPSWSIDGRKIVYKSYKSGNDEICVINADGTNEVVLTSNPLSDFDPHWSR